MLNHDDREARIRQSQTLRQSRAQVRREMRDRGRISHEGDDSDREEEVRILHAENAVTPRKRKARDMAEAGPSGIAKRIRNDSIIGSAVTHG